MYREPKAISSPEMILFSPSAGLLFRSEWQYRTPKRFGLESLRNSIRSHVSFRVLLQVSSAVGLRFSG